MSGDPKEVLLAIFSILVVLILVVLLVGACHEYLTANRKKRDDADDDAPYKLEKPYGYPPLNMAVPERVTPSDDAAPRGKRPYTKRSKYWTDTKRKKRGGKKYKLRSTYWSSPEHKQKLEKARAARKKSNPV